MLGQQQRILMFVIVFMDFLLLYDVYLTWSRVIKLFALFEELFHSACVHQTREVATATRNDIFMLF